MWLFLSHGHDDSLVLLGNLRPGRSFLFFLGKTFARVMYQHHPLTGLVCQLRQSGRTWRVEPAVRVGFELLASVPFDPIQTKKLPEYQRFFHQTSTSHVL